jgi:signal transduction histidine kinase
VARRAIHEEHAMRDEDRCSTMETAEEVRPEKVIERRKSEEISRTQNKVLIRTLNGLASEPDWNKFLDKLLVAITEELGAHSAALWFHDRKGPTTTLYKTVYGGPAPGGEPRLQHPFADREGQFKQGLVEQGLTEGPFVIKEVAKSPLLEPEVRGWMAAHGVKSLLCIPLIFGKKMVGLLTIRGATPEAFTARKKYLGELLGHYVTLAVCLMRLAGRAEEAAVLEERTRIAEEIHDSLAQNLVAIVTRLELASATLPAHAEESAAHLATAQTLAREGLAEARRCVWALVPAALEKENLPSALRKMVTNFNDMTPTEIRLTVEGSPRRLAQETEINLFRISQEAVNNALRHAEADRIQVRLSYDPQKISLSIADDGHGWRPQEDGDSRGFGLVSLRERAKRAGGQATILSESGVGTNIVVEVPLVSPSPGGMPL